MKVWFECPLRIALAVKSERPTDRSNPQGQKMWAGCVGGSQPAQPDSFRRLWWWTLANTGVQKKSSWLMLLTMPATSIFCNTHTHTTQTCQPMTAIIRGKSSSHMSNALTAFHCHNYHFIICNFIAHFQVNLDQPVSHEFSSSTFLEHTFLPCNAMLAWHMSSSCVCLSVCHT